MKDTLVAVESASFAYRPDGASIVDNVRFSVETGDFILLRGPNGCGKSTIIKGMLGVAYVVDGDVRWNVAMEHVGYVPQESTLSGAIPYTVLDIVYCGIVTRQKNHLKDRAMSALAAVEMDAKTDLRFGALSGGQKRRVLFARALVRNPRVLILDEPTANVDVHTEKVIEQLIGAFTSNNDAAVIAVAHATDFARNARVIRVENGGCHG